MYPEGDPASDASQEILYWQRCTMEVMYKRIGDALKHYKVREEEDTYIA